MTQACAAVQGEHGTGRNVAPYVEMEWGTKAYDLMWEIKELFDPEYVLNPGVLLNRVSPAANQLSAADACYPCAACSARLGICMLCYSCAIAGCGRCPGHSACHISVIWLHALS